MNNLQELAAVKAPLNVEIKGISFNNQGACLMLFAIIEEFERRGVHANFLIEYSGTSIKKFPHRLWRKARYVRKGINLLAPLNLMPRALLSLFNIKKCSDVDLVLDASGFSYGDQWNWRVARDRLSSTIETLKRRGVPVVLLPQALGPFEKVDTRAQFYRIASRADIIFARDHQSLGYAKEVASVENLIFAPDFTPAVINRPLTDPDQFSGRACIIPNNKMLEKREDNSHYLSFLKLSISETQKLGLRPFILLHELKEDTKLMESFLENEKLTVEVIAPEDVRSSKAIIAASYLLISSRFHGVVSGLSQSVPTIATGWSHKYRELMHYYECSEFLIEPENSRQLKSTLNKLVSLEHYELLQDNLKRNSQRHLAEIPQMWDLVFATISQTAFDKNYVSH